MEPAREEILRELVDTGTTVLLTTQYLEEADRLAHRIAVIDRGKVIAEGTPVELKARLGATVVELGYGEARQLAGRATELVARLLPAHPEADGSTVRITSDDGSRVVVEALRALDAEGLSPITVAVREPSLDDVFLALTGHHAESADDGNSAQRGGS